MIALRYATPADADRLFAWRNDPVTRAAFRSTAPISREEHDRWMKFNVTEGYAEHVVLIAEMEEGAVGVVRFDANKKDVMEYEVSLTIAPEFRGFGFARDVLSRACDMIEDFALTAQIRTENAASQKAFRSCGFSVTGSDDHFVNYRRRAPG
jgi:RimJ/RimL family protein N-acetyltransferase